MISPSITHKLDRKEERVLEFWNTTISGLYKHFAVPNLTKGQIKESFKMHNSFPLGIDNVISELIRRGHFIPLEDLKSRIYYKSKEDKLGWFKWIWQKTYQTTIGLIWKNSAIADNIQLISVSHLNVILN